MLLQQSAVNLNTASEAFPIEKEGFSKNALQNIGLAALYFFSGKLSFLIAVSFKSVTSAIFFPEGFALVFIMLYGKRILPGVVFGKF